MIDPQVIEKLSVDGTTGEAKLKLMKDIAAEHKIDWDSVPFEREIKMEQADVLVSVLSLIPLQSVGRGVISINM